MNGHYEQLVLALFFLACLLVLNRSVRNTRKEEQRGSLHLACGLATLGLVALGSFAATNATWVPFLAGLDPGARQIGWFFGTAVGIVLMISGAGIHLRERLTRQAEQIQEQQLLESSRYVEQLSRVEHRLVILAQTCLQRIIDDTGARYCALYLVSRVNRSVHLAAAAPQEVTDHLSLDDLTVTDLAADGSLESTAHSTSLEGFGDSTGAPDVAAPILVHGEAVGFLTLWQGDQKVVSVSLKRHMQALADILARHVERQHHREYRAFQQKRDRLQARLHATSSSTTSFRTLLTELAPLIMSELACEQFSIAMQSRSTGVITLVTLGDSGKPLIEKLTAGSCGEPLRTLMATSRSAENPIIAENTADNPMPFTFGSMRHLAGTRIGVNRKTITTAIVGRSTKRPFDPLERVLVGDVLAAVAAARRVIASHGRTRRLTRRQKLLSQFILSALNNAPETVNQAGARIIRSEMKACSVKLTPSHTDESVVSVGNAKDRSMARPHGTRLPVRIDNQLVAWLMIESRDKAVSISAADQRFVVAVASVMFLVTRHLPAVRPVADHAMRSHVRAALGGILGSLELMARPEHTGDNTRERYLGIIDRSARRIQFCLDQPINAAMSHSGTRSEL